MVRLSRLAWLALLVWPAILGAQTAPELKSILERLDRLERENRTLSDEVRELKEQLAAAQAPAIPPATQPATLAERLDVQQQKIEEQAQTKVEAAQKFPIRLAGMALFNTFLDSKQNGGFDYPTAAFAPGPGRAGATMRQTIVGLEFHGPRSLWGGAVHGSVYMDFFTGSTAFTEYMRFRTGSIQIDWKTRRVMVGVEKPIFNPREPSSLAQVGVSPLTGTGNLWLWIPQARVEQDFAFGNKAGLRARAGVVKTSEVPPYDGTQVATQVAPARPGAEGRFEVFYKFDDDRHIEIAPGFHTSRTHANGFSIPSDLFSLDWSVIPVRQLEFTGAYFHGQNVANLGTGLINQGYAVYRRTSYAIGAAGGWGQFTIHAAPRVDVHVFAGRQDYDTTYLGTADVKRNQMAGINVFFRLAPNVLLGPELSQLRSVTIGQGTRINNHYDLALAYLF